ncbi:MAG: hypothetical protein ACE15E_16045 [Acidobacteriota bacterium]
MSSKAQSSLFGERGYLPKLVSEYRVDYRYQAEIDIGFRHDILKSG